MKKNETYNEIFSITQNIIQSGLSIDENWPNRIGNKITWVGQKDISIAIKNISYSEKYNVMKNDRNYNFKLLDGALIQMMYEYNRTGRNLISHRLAFFPSPNFERYDDSPEDYDNLYFGDSEFHDMLERNIITFPIRFDYNVNDDIFIEIKHPYSHITFGEYENCRIPVNSPLTPSIFINFIIRNFYNSAFIINRSFCEISNYRFTNTITENERKILHFNIK